MGIVRRRGARVLAAGAGAVAALGAATVLAQAYPARPVRVIVPFPAGGPADVAARLVAPRLAEVWNQQVVVDNRGGGSSIIGSELTARAAPDGYTLLCVSSSFTINASMFRKLPYDSVRDFTAIIPIAYGPGMVVVHPSVPARTMQEFIAYAKSRPNTMSFASSGSGSPGHLTFELIKRLSGISVTHVPYKGMATALTDILGGQVQAAIPTISAVLPHVRSGRLHGLAVTSAKRWPTVPDMPTIAENALPGFESALWYGLLGPAKLPQPIVAKVHAEVARITQLAEVRERLGAMGMDAMKMTPAEYAGYIRAEIDKWSKVVRESGAQVD